MAMITKMIRLLLYIFTILSITTSITSTSGFTTTTTINNENNNNNNVLLKEQPYNEPKNKCNQIITTIHPSHLSSILDSFLSTIAPESKSFIHTIFGPLLKYGIQIKTVCAGCHRIRSDLISMYGLSKYNQQHWDEACHIKKRNDENDENDHVYGSDIEHSGIVMIPMEIVQVQGNGSGRKRNNRNKKDRREKLVPKRGTMEGFIHAHTTKLNRYNVPSQMWTSTMTGERRGNQDDDFWSTEMFLCFLATATKGVVSFAPDYMGYGPLSFLNFTSGDAEYDEYGNKNVQNVEKRFLQRTSYKTSFLPLWVRVSADLKKETNCQSMLGDAAFVEGYGEGGYAALAIADGLHKALNIDIIQVRAGASPFRLVDTFLSQIVNFQYGLLWDHMESIILLSASYSSSPSFSSRQLLQQQKHLPQHQQLLNAKYRNEFNPEMNIQQWLEEGDITADDIEERVYNLATALSYDGDANNFLFKELLDPSFVRFLEKVMDSNSTDPCTSPLSSSSSSSFSERKEKRFKHYARLCQSLMDNSMVDIVEKSNYPIHLCHSEEDELYTFTNLPNMTSNPNHVTLTKQTGDHILAGGFCFSSDVMFLTSTLFRQYVPTAKHSNTDKCPRPSPNTCVDSNIPFEIQVKTKSKKKKTVTKSCSWIKNASSSSWRCGIDGVKEMCPMSCGTCTVCADTTSKLKFTYNGQVVTKDCNWVGSNNKEARCKVAGIRNACRMTCHRCP